jgi:hypothetical protein
MAAVQAVPTAALTNSLETLLKVHHLVVFK